MLVYTDTENVIKISLGFDAGVACIISERDIYFEVYFSTNAMMLSPISRLTNVTLDIPPGATESI